MASKQDMTPLRHSVLKFFNSYYESNRYAPTLAEICEGTGITSESVAKAALDRLTEDGYFIKGKPKSSRTIIPTFKPYNERSQQC